MDVQVINCAPSSLTVVDTDREAIRFVQFDELLLSLIHQTIGLNNFLSGQPKERFDMPLRNDLHVT